ncbi:uncharacterized protein LOC131956784 [Physella acuta]|uniref:uncharacterized protein LOC131956784 n=1 Tax=Physella acuta TaxID=109671 RepID=UPI0027DE651F|nr:uncharacterized protein LOC131956784 [Physella acuta]
MYLLSLSSCLLLCLMSSVHSQDALSGDETLKFFGALVQPLSWKREILNNATDRGVDRIIESLKEIPLGLHAIHEAAKKIKVDLPQHKQMTSDILGRLSDLLAQTRSRLLGIFSDCGSGLKFSDLQVTTEDYGAFSEQPDLDIDLDAQNVNLPSPEAEAGSSDERRLFDLLLQPQQYDPALLNRVLDQFGREKHITISDAASAILKIAEGINQRHSDRLRKHIGKMREVAQNLRKLKESLAHCQREIENLLRVSTELKYTAHENVKKAIQAASEISGSVLRLGCL